MLSTAYLIGFLPGFLIGGMVGFLLCAILVAGRSADDASEKAWEQSAHGDSPSLPRGFVPSFHDEGNI